MALEKDPSLPEFSDLKMMLAQSKIPDNALSQTLSILIDRLDQLEFQKADIIQNIDNSVKNIVTNIINIIGSLEGSAPNQATYLTSGNESIPLPNSKQLLAGTGVTFDDTVPNRRIINAVGNTDLDYVGDYVPGNTYNDGDIVVGPDGITYVCTKNGVNTPPEPWPGSSPGSVIHHTTHEPGGGDPMEVDATPTRGSLRTLGTGANQAAQGSSLAGYAQLNANNIFTQPQNLESNGPFIILKDTSAPVDQRVFRLLSTSQLLYIDALNDAQNAVIGRFIFYRNGSLKANGYFYEENRLTPIGHWQNQPFNAADYFAGAGGTWTVGSGSVIQNRYAIIGRTLHWILYVSWFSGSSSVTGAPTALNVRIPGGFTNNSNTVFTAAYSVINGARTTADVAPSGTLVGISKLDVSAFPVGTFGIICQLTFEVF